MKKIAITGGIAAGKSSVCAMFSSAYYIPIFDADKAVHQLYGRNDVAQAMNCLVPNCLNDEGQICREKLSRAINLNPDLLEDIEDFIHPLVRQLEHNFMQYQVRCGAKIMISDVPLLLESGGESRYDMVIIAHCPLWLRRKRAMLRPNMSAQKWRTIIANQMSDAGRLKQADYVINTSIGLPHTAMQVKNFMAKIYMDGVK